MSNKQIRDDLTAKAATIASETIRRELAIASVVLDTGEVRLMHLQVAAAVMLEAISSAVIYARPGTDRSAFWDETQDMFFDRIRTAKPALLTEIEARLTGAGVIA